VFLTEAASGEGSNLGDALIVPVDVHDPQLVMKSYFSDQQIGDRCAVPHPMVMCEVALESERPFQQIGRSCDDRETGVQLRLQLVVVARGAGRVELLELTHRANKELSGELG
jgi:hypothetical protein